MKNESIIPIILVILALSLLLLPLYAEIRAKIEKNCNDRGGVKVWQVEGWT